ncbi:hypothetical protein PM8797T_17007 [Gimesia maris DSM 8797]|nr:hypothetical protein PM8797T_17007 [Gimesia maris DSM 8797]
MFLENFARREFKELQIVLNVDFRWSCNQ